jgi:hypothetical protein
MMSEGAKQFSVKTDFLKGFPSPGLRRVTPIETREGLKGFSRLVVSADSFEVARTIHAEVDISS